MPQKRAVIVTDPVVAELHLPTLLEGLAETGFATSEIVVPQGEASKSLTNYVDLLDELLEARIERRTAVIALGGVALFQWAATLAVVVEGWMRFPPLADPALPGGA